jgi:hypothetical protein
VKWATRARTPAEGADSAWLILRFVDPEAEVLHADEKGVPEATEREGVSCSFVAPEGGKPASEAILEEYGWKGHPALERMVRVFRGGTGPEEEELAALYACVRAIVDKFSVLGFDDRQLLELTLPLHDALYAWCQEC